MTIFDAPVRRACAAFVCLVSVCSAAPVSAEWRRVDSPNFIVIGDVSAGQLRDVAVKFEGFREVLGRVISVRATSTAVPTVVIVFPNDRAFTPFKPRYAGKPVEDIGGVFYQGRDVNYIALVPGSRQESLRIIFHEYAHLLISNFALNLPVWLDEGLAEYYSTYESARGGARATIGAPIASHLYVLGERTPLPLQDLIRVDHDSPLYNEGERRSVLYAQSWALTHMLLLGEPRRTEKLAAFMRMIAGGADEAQAWQQAFGADPVERDLLNYVRRTWNSSRIAMTSLAPSAAVRSVSRCRSTSLGVLKFRFTAAARYFEERTNSLPSGSFMTA
jgi:hypothetical protein